MLKKVAEWLHQDSRTTLSKSQQVWSEITAKILAFSTRSALVLANGRHLGFASKHATQKSLMQAFKTLHKVHVQQKYSLLFALQNCIHLNLYFSIKPHILAFFPSFKTLTFPFARLNSYIRVTASLSFAFDYWPWVSAKHNRWLQGLNSANKKVSQKIGQNSALNEERAASLL